MYILYCKERFFLFMYLKSGNTSIEHWQHSSLMSTGLCKVHFKKEDFRADNPEKIYRYSIPISYLEIENVDTESQEVQEAVVEESMPSEFIQANTSINDGRVEISTESLDLTINTEPMIHDSFRIGDKLNEYVNEVDVAMLSSDNIQVMEMDEEQLLQNNNSVALVDHDYIDGNVQQVIDVENTIACQSLSPGVNNSNLDNFENSMIDPECEFDAAKVKKTYPNGKDLFSFDNVENEDEIIIRFNGTEEYESENMEALVVLDKDDSLQVRKQPGQLNKKKSFKRSSQRNQCSPFCSEATKKFEIKNSKIAKAIEK